VDDSLRLGFAGSPDFAATILTGLLDAGYPIELVLTQPDRPTGRGRRLAEVSVKRLAVDRDLPVRQPASLKGVDLSEHRLDLLVVAAYGLLLPRHILDTPRYGCLNVHASLLPRWRGAAPVERAMMAGDRETGVCLMRMEEGLDTGPIYASERLTIGDTETGAELEARLALTGSRLLVANLPDIPNLTPTPQPTEGVTYAQKITADDTRVDWQRSAVEIDRQIRALTGRRPAATGCETQGVRIRLLASRVHSEAAPLEQLPGTIIGLNREGILVACGTGHLLVTRLQLNRGKGTPMAAAAAANGYPDLLAAGRRLIALADD
jgi:methionyl-tRNA formyltransferase